MRVLFATNFSDSCQNALNYLIDLIQSKSIKIDLIHVFDIPIAITSSMPYRAVEGMILEREKAMQEQLDDLRSEIPPENRGRNHVIYGSYPAVEIAEVAHEEEYAFITMSLREKYSLTARMFGSVTAHTIQLTDVPVLAIPSGARFSGIHKILFPTASNDSDKLSEGEEQALAWIAEYSSLFQFAKIHLLNIQPDDGKDKVDVTYRHQPFDDLDFTRSRAENIEDGILEFSQREQVELLAFYKPHRSFWERLFHTSHTRKMLYKSRTPLLLLPARNGSTT